MRQRIISVLLAPALVVLVIALACFTALNTGRQSDPAQSLAIQTRPTADGRADITTDSGCPTPEGWETLESQRFELSLSYPSLVNVGTPDGEPVLGVASEVYLSSWTPEGRTSYMTLFSGDTVEFNPAASDLATARDFAESARQRYLQTDADGLTTLRPSSIKEIVYHDIRWYSITFHLLPPGDNATSETKVLMYANHPSIPAVVGLEYVDDSLMAEIACTLRPLASYEG